MQGYTVTRSRTNVCLQSLSGEVGSGLQLHCVADAQPPSCMYTSCIRSTLLSCSLPSVCPLAVVAPMMYITKQFKYVCSLGFACFVLSPVTLERRVRACG